MVGLKEARSVLCELAVGGHKVSLLLYQLHFALSVRADYSPPRGGENNCSKGHLLAHSSPCSVVQSAEETALRALRSVDTADISRILRIWSFP